MAATAAGERAASPQRRFPALTASGAATRGELALLALLTAIGLALRLTSLSRSLFTDEAYSLALAQRGFGHMIGLFGYEANGMTYPIVLWPVVHLFGESEAVIRAPAVAAGVASVPAMWWTGRRFGGAGVALIAAALIAINPMAVFYGHQARAYSFVILAGTLSFGFLARALARDRARGMWIGYVLAMTALAYSEILAPLLVLPAQAILLAGVPRERRRRWALALGTAALCCVPLLVAAAIARGRRNALYWLPRPNRALVTLALQEFTAGFSDVTALRWLTLAAGAAIVLAAALLLRGRVRRRAQPDDTPGELRDYGVALAWALLPGVLLIVASIATPLFYPRYAIVALPGICLLVALAAVAVASRARIAALAIACLAVVVLAALAADVRQRNKLQESWPPVAAWLRERRPDQSVIVDASLVLPTLGYYDHQFRAPDGDLIVQEWHDRPLPAGFVGYRDPGGYGNVPVGQPTVAAISAAARRGDGTVWLLISETDDELQGNPREGAAVQWARAHCHVTVHTSIGVWLMRASGCRTR